MRIIHRETNFFRGRQFFSVQVVLRRGKKLSGISTAAEIIYMRERERERERDGETERHRERQRQRDRDREREREREEGKRRRGRVYNIYPKCP